MDKLIESFEEIIDGASSVELVRETGTTGVTRVNAFAVHWDWDRGEGCGPCIPERRLGFAKPEEAEDALTRMRKTLNEHGYRLICTSRNIDVLNHQWVHEYYCQD